MLKTYASSDSSVLFFLTRVFELGLFLHKFFSFLFSPFLLFLEVFIHSSSLVCLFH